MRRGTLSATRGARPDRAALQRRERVAACTIYAALGFLVGTWSARIPAVRQQVGISVAELGVALLGSGLGILFGIALATPLSWRIAGQRWVAGGCAAYAVTLTATGLARNVVVLFGVLLLAGLVSGLLTAQQNLVGARIERAYGRPVMSLLFGVQSIGVLVGGASGAVAAAAGLPPAGHFALAATAATVTSTVSSRWLAHSEPAGAPGRTPASEPAAGAVRSARSAARTWLLAGLAFVAVLAFGTTMDWSALYVSGDLGATQATAAVAPTLFVGLVSLGRLVGNAAAGRHGPTWTLRAGLGLASAGMAVVATAADAVTALVGLALSGAGLSCMLPLVTAAAATLVPQRPAATMGLVTGVACCAYLVGPPLVGLVATRAGLAAVFSGLSALLLVSGIVAGRALGGRVQVRPDGP